MVKSLSLIFKKKLDAKFRVKLLNYWEKKVPGWSKIEHEISAVIGEIFRIKEHTNIAGGDTNQAYRISGVVGEGSRSKKIHFFVKINQQQLDMFAAEAAGLQELEKAHAIRVPHVICNGIEANQSYLVLENLSLVTATTDAAKILGQQLAALHKNTSAQFGWSRDNTIGATVQINSNTDTWIDFWREHRLGFQLDLAKQNGASHTLCIKGADLLNNLAYFFTAYKPKASLLHGDLWSGNYGYLKSGEPVIFDPAVYYGDRETDIAMTELFGGFPAGFYSAYNEVWPLDEGYQQRKILYNLYHILNHFNLFGGGYAMQAENMIDSLLKNI